MHKIIAIPFIVNNIRGYRVSNPAHGIENLSTINVFVGPNNSGKSRFLRELFRQLNSSDIHYTPFDFEKELNEKERIIEELQKRISDDDLPIIQPLRDISISSKAGNNKTPMTDLLSFLDNIFNNSYNYGSLIDRKASMLPYQEKISLRSLLNSYRDKVRISTRSKPMPADHFTVLYIPTLRGLRIFNTKAPIDASPDDYDIYKQRTIKDYFTKVKAPYIFTGLSLYHEIRNHLLGNLKKRQDIAQFQEFLSQAFFNGEAVTLIPSVDDNVLHIKIGDEHEKPIYEVGDGIQSIIILTFPLFINTDKNLLVFIEEPELFMHPGMQRTFIEVLLSERFKNYQYFITTHSNHFLDITLDIERVSIYTFHKELDDSDSSEKTPTFLIENVDNEKTDILDLIGVRNSSVFLSNCTIWVEGITDRLYLRSYLKIYQERNKGKVFKEDLHYSFVEYGGGNVTHWSFLDDPDPNHPNICVDRLCGRLFLVTDRDNTGTKTNRKNQLDQASAKQKRHQKLRQKLGNRYYCLKCNEIENLLHEKILHQVIAEYEGITSEELSKELKQSFLQKNYANSKLGKYIEDNINNKRRKASYGGGSGTVSDKVNFCKKAISYIQNWDDLSDEARKLTKRIYSFIESNNP